MQTFNLDLSKKGVIPLLYAKQRDVGTKILINITDNGDAYAIPANASFSVWFSGKSGEGNYTAIDGKSAFSITGNAVTVELIYQMLNNAGEHVMCLVMNGTDGSQLGLWNIPYYVEAIPGADSAAAQQYYQAFLQAQERAETAAQVAEDAQEHANAAAQTATDAADRAEQVVASVDKVTLEQMRALVTEAENLSTEAVDAAARAGEDAARAERAAESVDKATLAQMQELIAGAEDLSVEAATAAERAEKAAEDAEDSAYNKQNKLAWATDEDIDAMFDGTYEGVENEDPEGDGYLPGGGSGEPGADGKSAYEIAQEYGFEGTEEEWLASLQGEKGDKGDPGADGYTPQKGVDYYTDADKEEMVEAVIEAQKKHYELIETITLEENSTITRSQEPNGKPYNFKQIYLALKTNAQGKAGWLLFRNGNTQIGACYMGGGKADATSYNAVAIRPEAGFWRTTWSDWGTNNLTVNSHAYANERDYYPIKGVDEYPAITSFVLQVELTAGTEIQIWGVRADA